MIPADRFKWIIKWNLEFWYCPFTISRWLFYNSKLGLLDRDRSPLPGWAMGKEGGSRTRYLLGIFRSVWLLCTWRENLARKGWSKVFVRLSVRLCETFDFEPSGFYMRDWENEIRRDLTSANPECEINCLFVHMFV